jgi:hypothetical protein
VAPDALRRSQPRGPRHHRLRPLTSLLRPS